jgi:hypothetical protein
LCKNHRSENFRTSFIFLVISEQAFGQWRKNIIEPNVDWSNHPDAHDIDNVWGNIRLTTDFPEDEYELDLFIYDSLKMIH